MAFDCDARASVKFFAIPSRYQHSRAAREDQIFYFRHRAIPKQREAQFLSSFDMSVAQEPWNSVVRIRKFTEHMCNRKYRV